MQCKVRGWRQSSCESLLKLNTRLDIEGDTGNSLCLLSHYFIIATSLLGLYGDLYKKSPCKGREPKSHHILMFVCLHKDARQCCGGRMLDCAHCSGQP